MVAQQSPASKPSHRLLHFPLHVPCQGSTLDHQPSLSAESIVCLCISGHPPNPSFPELILLIQGLAFSPTYKFIQIIQIYPLKILLKLPHRKFFSSYQRKRPPAGKPRDSAYVFISRHSLQKLQGKTAYLSLGSIL